MARLKQLQTERHLSPVRGKVVIALHGLAAHRAMMTPLVEHLEKEGGFTVLNVTYPSTRGTIAQHAQRLAGIVEHLDEATEIDFVAHSMGNLVVRYYLQDAVDASEDGHIDSRIKRFVMLGPPNHGAHSAVALGGNPIFDNVMGEAAQQLGRRWGELAARLDTPPLRVRRHRRRPAESHRLEPAARRRRRRPGQSRRSTPGRRSRLRPARSAPRRHDLQFDGQRLHAPLPHRRPPPRRRPAAADLTRRCAAGEGAFAQHDAVKAR